MGISAKDIKIFYDTKSNSYIITNDYKLRKLMSAGMSLTKAKKNSHAHINKKKTAEIIKENILGNKREKSRSLRVLNCYVRICDKSYKYYDWVCGLYNTRKQKGVKGKFIRINKGVNI